MSQKPFVDWLADRLARAGTRRAFGVPGGGASLDLIAALRSHGIETIVSAREDAAVIMAGVSGLLADTPGVAFTTKGPGLASASNGLASAALDRLPALLIAESFEADELSYVTHQVYDQPALVTPLLDGAGARVLQPTAEAVEHWLADGVVAPYRPAVLLTSPADLAAPVRDGDDAASRAETLAAGPGIEQALSLLATSSRPVIVAGLEAARPTVATALRSFTDRLGAPVLMTYMAKGVIPDTAPAFAGIFTGGAIEQPCVREADLIILAGLDPVELIRKPWPYDAPVLDLSEAVHQPHYLMPEARAIAPLASTLDALAAEIKKADWGVDEIADHRRRFLEGMAVAEEAGLSSARVVKAAAECFKAEPRLAVDAGAHMFSACAFWPCAEPRDLLISNGLATMGFALPAALAAALDAPDRGAVAMTGDGGLLMCLGELKTAAEVGATICVIVFNDGRLSLIDIKREERQMPDLGMSWQAPDFAAIARGFGLTAWRAGDAAELDAALRQAAAATGPRLIDVRIDPRGYNAQIRALRG